MERCITCKSELTDPAKPCPSCGALVEVATGTVASIAMDLHSPSSNGSPKNPGSNGTPRSRPSISQISSVSIPDDGRFLPGTLVNGRYRIVGLLGRGGMGEVYRATDLTLAQPVALKFLPEAGVTERVLERFHAEVRIARQVSHPNICRVYDIGEVDGQPFISMEYVDGEDLASLLQRIGRLPADKALETSRKICAGLAAAHDKGVIHRDLKPQNIMLNKRGEPVIMDFGLAAVATQLTGPEARNGTPAYMSPEQLRGEEVTTKSDIYALGLVLYEIFAGRRAYEAQTLGDLLKQQESAQVTSLSAVATDVEPQVEKVIKRCLNPNPALRPANALAVAAALPGGDPLAAALAAGETPSPEMVAASGKTEGMDLRYSIPLLVFILVIVIGLPFWSAPLETLQQLPVTDSPAVAAHEARRIAASFGYTQLPRDYFIDPNLSASLGYWTAHDRKGKSWSELANSEPFNFYYYRESPDHLTAWPFGATGSGNPPPAMAGMIDMRLTATGHLREFEAIPPERLPPGSAPGSPFDEAALFIATGYDRATFTETTPERVPRVNSDLRKSWKGPAPGLPDTEVRIEAASLAGKITAVRVMFPWSNTQRAPPRPATPAALGGRLGRNILYALAGLFALILAGRNLQLKRGDRKGAFWLALIHGLASYLGWFGSYHLVASPDEWALMLNSAADSLFSAMTIWVVYLALEPAVRSRWPQALVTWTRLQAGRFGDAQVGAHVLMGAAVGVIESLGFLTLRWLDGLKDGIPTGTNLQGSNGPLAWIGTISYSIHTAIGYGFLVLFLIFFFRVLLRKDYLAAFAMALALALIDDQNVWTRDNPWIKVTLMIGCFSILAFLVLRLGVVANIVSILFVNIISSTSVDTRLSAWYTPYGLASITFLASIAIYAFWRSIGARTLADEQTG